MFSYEIEKEILDRARDLVADRARLLYSIEYISTSARMYYFALDDVSIAEAHVFLQGKSIVSESHLRSLVESLGVSDLFRLNRNDHSPVINKYIMDHAADCKLMWEYLRTSGGSYD